METINLKCEGIDLWDNGQTMRRFNQTFKRIHKFNPHSNVLAIGEYNKFNWEMAKRFGLKYYNTEGDLDTNLWSPVNLNGDYEFSSVFCTEVLEHLINPLLFLTNLKEIISRNTLVFITYPYQTRFFKGQRHWKEFTRQEFYTLVTKAGYEILHYDSFRNLLTFKIYLSGIRPLIKLVMSVLGLIKIQFYVIKVK